MADKENMFFFSEKSFVPWTKIVLLVLSIEQIAFLACELMHLSPCPSKCSPPPPSFLSFFSIWSLNKISSLQNVLLNKWVVILYLSFHHFFVDKERIITLSSWIQFSRNIVFNREASSNRKQDKLNHFSQNTFFSITRNLGSCVGKYWHI